MYKANYALNKAMIQFAIIHNLELHDHVKKKGARFFSFWNGKRQSTS